MKKMSQPCEKKETKSDKLVKKKSQTCEKVTKSDKLVKKRHKPWEKNEKKWEISVK